MQRWIKNPFTTSLFASRPYIVHLPQTACFAAFFFIFWFFFSLLYDKMGIDIDGPQAFDCGIPIDYSSGVRFMKKLTAIILCLCLLCSITVVGLAQESEEAPLASASALPEVSEQPSSIPTDLPVESPGEVPSPQPDAEPNPTPTPIAEPTPLPTEQPTAVPSESPSPTEAPSEAPSEAPTETPSASPVAQPSESPAPGASPTATPSVLPTPSAPLMYSTSDADPTEEIVVMYAEPQPMQLDNLSMLSSDIMAIEQVSDVVDVIVPAPDVDADAMIDQLNQSPNVLFAGKNDVRYLNAAPNDPYLTVPYSGVTQWWYSSIQADQTWDLARNSAPVVVAVLDSGLNTSHPDLQGRIAKGYDFVNKTTNVTDTNGHGTSVASCVAAATNNSTGIAGVAGASNVKVAPFRVSSGRIIQVSKIVAALRMAADRPDVQVINMSYGGYIKDYLWTYPPQSFLDKDVEYQAVQYAAQKGKILISSSGNEADDPTLAGAYSFPASYDNVISVASLSSGNRPSYYSQYNDRVDLSAPGEDVLMASYTGSYTISDGTSFSSPIVAGCAAFLLSVSPNQSPAAVEKILTSTAYNPTGAGYDKYYGYGKVQLKRAYEQIVIPVSKITLDRSSLTMGLSSSVQLSATITPSNAANKALSWSSSNPAVADVSASGRVTANALGTATITVTAEGGKTASCTVTVQQNVPNISLSASAPAVGVSKKIKMTASVSPASEAQYPIQWSSSNKKIATVDSKGVVYGRGVGRVTITATLQNSARTKATYALKVTPMVQQVKISKTSMNLFIGQSYRLKTGVAPSGASKSVLWTTGNAKRATVNSKGMVTATGTGKVRITATATDGSRKSVSCLITVYRPVKSVSMSPTSLTLKKGKVATLKAKVLPANASKRTLKWVSSNPKAVQVSPSTGKIKAVGVGTSTITAYALDGTKKRARCRVTVYDMT